MLPLKANLLAKNIGSAVSNIIDSILYILNIFRVNKNNNIKLENNCIVYTVILSSTDLKYPFFFLNSLKV